MSGAVALDLPPGVRLVVDDLEWTVESFEPQYGRVLLARGPDEVLRTSVWALVNHPGCRTSATPWASRGRQPVMLADLTAHQQELTRVRFAHVQEAETGYRSGIPCGRCQVSLARSTTRTPRR